jgi:hypothetical protein
MGKLMNFLIIAGLLACVFGSGSAARAENKAETSPTCLAVVLKSLVGSNLPLGNELYKVPEGYSLSHSVRRGFGAGGSWVDWLKSLAGSKNKLQEQWPETSMRGQIWTLHNDRRFVNEAHEVVAWIEFEIDPAYSFYDPTNTQHAQTWNQYLETHAKDQNRFSKEQVERLRKADLPYFSGFYDAYKIAGIWHKYGDKAVVEAKTRFGGAAWNIANFQAVRRLKIETPTKLGDLRNIEEFEPK